MVLIRSRNVKKISKKIILVVFIIVIIFCGTHFYNFKSSVISLKLTPNVYAQLIIEDTVNVGVDTAFSDGNLTVKNSLRLIPASEAEVDVVEGALYYDKDKHYLLYYDGSQWLKFGYSLTLGTTSERPFVDIIGYQQYNDFIPDWITPFDKAKNSTFIGADSQCPDGYVLTGFIIQTGSNCGTTCSYSFDFKRLKAICREIQ